MKRLILFLTIANSILAQNTYNNSISKIDGNQNINSYKTYLIKEKKWKEDINGIKFSDVFPGVWLDIDEALKQGDIIYFFRKSQCIAFDTKTKKIKDGPKNIANFFPGIFDYGIDAVVDWGNGKLYFFSGKYYCRFDVKANSLDDGYPLESKGRWGNTSSYNLIEHSPDAALNMQNGTAVFFKEDRHTNYNIKKDDIDGSFKKNKNWNELPFNTIHGAFYISDNEIVVFNNPEKSTLFPGKPGYDGFGYSSCIWGNCENGEGVKYTRTDYTGTIKHGNFKNGELHGKGLKVEFYQQENFSKGKFTEGVLDFSPDKIFINNFYPCEKNKDTVIYDYGQLGKIYNNNLHFHKLICKQSKSIPIGKGELIYSDGSKDSVEFEEGIIISPEVLKTQSGCVQGNCIDGWGTYVWHHASAYRYEGLWKNGKPYGFGMMYYVNGDFYIGELNEEGEYHGRGIFRGSQYLNGFFSNGVIYDGKSGFKIIGLAAIEKLIADNKWKERLAKMQPGMICFDCDGAGKVKSGNCPKCKGGGGSSSKSYHTKGEYAKSGNSQGDKVGTWQPAGYRYTYSDCGSCKGTGYSVSTCSTCNGKGRFE